MFLFLMLTAVAGLIICREGCAGSTFFVSVYASAGLLLGLAGFEILSGTIEPLKSDELYYVETATGADFNQILLKSVRFGMQLIIGY